MLSHTTGCRLCPHRQTHVIVKIPHNPEHNPVMSASVYSITQHCVFSSHGCSCVQVCMLSWAWVHIYVLTRFPYRHQTGDSSKEDSSGYRTPETETSCHIWVPYMVTHFPNCTVNSHMAQQSLKVWFYVTGKRNQVVKTLTSHEKVLGLFLRKHGVTNK